MNTWKASPRRDSWLPPSCHRLRNARKCGDSSMTVGSGNRRSGTSSTLGLRINRAGTARTAPPMTQEG
jgi:hypothetical protein